MGFLDRFRAAEPDEEPDPPPADAGAERCGGFAALRRLALAGGEVAVQRPVLIDGLLAYGISLEAISAIMTNVRDGIVLFEDDAAAPSSRVGGSGELPVGVDWPLDCDGQPLTFIARFALGELPSLEPFPAEGTLLVYWSERCFEFDRMDFRVATRVFWVPPDQGLQKVAAPPDAKTYKPTPLTGALMPVLGEVDRITVPPEDRDPFYEAFDELMQLYDHQLLGLSRDVQGPVLQEVSYWFEQGFPSTRADYTDAELAGEGWMLLGQIEETRDLAFGDGGALYLVIPEEDLRAWRFDRVIGIMQCS